MRPRRSSASYRLLKVTIPFMLVSVLSVMPVDIDARTRPPVDLGDPDDTNEKPHSGPLDSYSLVLQQPRLDKYSAPTSVRPEYVIAALKFWVTLHVK
jgi:hypothetical protein